MKNELYDGSWYSKNADYHDGAQQMLNRVLDMLGEYETMDPIPDINIQLRNIDIPSTQIWDVKVPSTIPRVVPVTTQIGTPIVNMPGCVTAHEKSDKNDTIVSDDPKGAKIFVMELFPRSILFSMNLRT